MANCNGRIVITVELFDCGFICSATIYGDLLGKTIVINGFDQESFGCFFISLSCLQEVDGVAFFIDGPVEIMPYSFDLDVGLIHSPAGANSFLPFPEFNFQDLSR